MPIDQRQDEAVQRLLQRHPAFLDDQVEARDEGVKHLVGCRQHHGRDAAQHAKGGPGREDHRDRRAADSRSGVARRAAHHAAPASAGGTTPSASLAIRSALVKAGREADLLAARIGQRDRDFGRNPRRAAAEHDHLVGEIDRFRDRMRHEQHRGAGLAPDAQQQVVHLQPRQFVERAERLVHQQQFRLMDQRAAKRDALLHAARQLMRARIAEIRKGRRGSSSCVARSRAARSLRFRISIVNSTLSITERHGIRLGLWNTKP